MKRFIISIVVMILMIFLANWWHYEGLGPEWLRGSIRMLLVAAVAASVAVTASMGVLLADEASERKR